VQFMYQYHEVSGPPQQSIPIWIGGNSKLTMRRVAQRANGWLPMLGSQELFVTTRTASLSSAGELAAAISQLRADAGPRGAGLDVAVAYADPSLHDADADFGRHRAVLAELGEAGATWVIVPGRSEEPAAFIERFGKEMARS
jgi:alkanesulfonate monooxygenase SsuD/methylene tetrahydromethanopterin reductase-like flavin-dependent oxidoreductase (luciferase family)